MIAGTGGDAPARAERLLRAVAWGGARFERVVLTRNRRVMASVGDGGRTLRLHEAFGDAPEAVLRALGGILSGESRPDVAHLRSVVREYLADAVPAELARRRRRTGKPMKADAPYLDRLRGEFDSINESHFGGALPRVPITLSGRMRRRNGCFRTDPPEITISRRLCTHGAAGEAEHTLRHEMIHLWQWVRGVKPGHGTDFRRLARALDVHPRASRPVRWRE